MNSWIEAEQPPHKNIKNLNKILKIPEFICSLLLQRNINSLEKAKHFFRPNLDLLHDPFLMKDMLKVVERIEFFKSKKIMILGDYDVDGSASTSLFIRFFKSINHPFFYYRIKILVTISNRLHMCLRRIFKIKFITIDFIVISQI